MRGQPENGAQMGVAVRVYDVEVRFTVRIMGVSGEHAEESAKQLFTYPIGVLKALRRVHTNHVELLAGAENAPSQMVFTRGTETGP